MSKHILSIIIPAYNVEKFIEKCLVSTQHQGLPSDAYEVIVVNDGSPDNSLQIAERLAAQYSNIRIVSRPNGGLSAERNTGSMRQHHLPAAGPGAGPPDAVVAAKAPPQILSSPINAHKKEGILTGCLLFSSFI